MTKSEFMQKLDGALHALQPEDRKEILSDFEEHFSNGMASGKSEEEVASELGDPVALAGQYTEGLPPAAPASGSRVAQGILAAIGLLFFDLMIAIPVIGTLLGVWVTLWSMDLVLFAVTLFCFVAPFLAFVHLPAALVGLGLIAWGFALLAMTVLYGIGMYYVSRWSFRGLAAFGRAHVRIIKGGTNR